MSEICQFSINNKLGYFNQLITMIKMIEMLCDSEINETNEKMVVQKDRIQFIKRESRENQKKRRN